MVALNVLWLGCTSSLGPSGKSTGSALAWSGVRRVVPSLPSGTRVAPLLGSSENRAASGRPSGSVAFRNTTMAVSSLVYSLSPTPAREMIHDGALAATDAAASTPTAAIAERRSPCEPLPDASDAVRPRPSSHRKNATRLTPVASVIRWCHRC